MKRLATCFALIASALALTLAATPSRAVNGPTVADPLNSRIGPQAPLADSQTLIARARESAAHDLPSVRADINRLFLALLKSKDLPDQYNLIDAIYEIGNLREGIAPIAVKAYIQRLALVALPKLPKSCQNYASSKWGYLFPSRKEMEREIGIVAPESREKEQAGLKVLSARKLGVSFDSLQRAVEDADEELTEALLLAGLRVDAFNADKTHEIVWLSLASACRNPTLPPARINRVLDLLAANGHPFDYADKFEATILFHAAIGCPGPVAEHLIELGAPFARRNRQGVTPLEMALSSERFEFADVLMKHGARLTKSAGQRVLFFPNRDSRLEDYVKRATTPVDDAEKPPVPTIPLAKRNPA